MPFSNSGSPGNGGKLLINHSQIICTNLHWTGITVAPLKITSQLCADYGSCKIGFMTLTVILRVQSVIMVFFLRLYFRSKWYTLPSSFASSLSLIRLVTLIDWSLQVPELHSGTCLKYSLKQCLTRDCQLMTGLRIEQWMVTTVCILSCRYQNYIYCTQYVSLQAWYP